MIGSLLVIIKKEKEIVSKLHHCKQLQYAPP